MELEERMRPPLFTDFNRGRRSPIRKSVNNSGRKSKHSPQLRPSPETSVKEDELPAARVINYMPQAQSSRPAQ
ncbi:hypothetical protein [Paenibacillus sp. P32E]|uniref:hypothetical protein n=1 Tax=Paenibacillus sp. P32E TaxID=1349434 RepID=UPI00093AD99E|nr:hypothetical protein [Paenibacillus sp. P32E]OKP85557.1 hypothetical protein A3848_22665 [Paenibacillus sp. P32E]